MKSISRVLLIAAGLALAPSLASADGQSNHFAAWLNARDAHQDHRVQHGIANGSLTPWEVKRLERHDRYLNAATDFALRDGDISRREFRYINHGYNHESRVIHRRKNDCDRR
jgi:hypothetical protein